VIVIVRADAAGSSSATAGVASSRSAPHNAVVAIDLMGVLSVGALVRMCLVLLL
jgi:hypothetical protein